MPILTRPGCIGKVLRCDLNINVFCDVRASVEGCDLRAGIRGSASYPEARKDVRLSPCEGRDGESLTR
jgi:hypothetical protein